MFGYTGTYKGHRVSVMGTGMGMPSISIYARELIVDYGVKKLIRVGTAGSLNEEVHVRELVWRRRLQPTQTSFVMTGHSTIFHKLLALICLIKPTISPKNLV